MLEEILPPVVVAEEAFADPPGVPLFPEEAAAVANAVAKRRDEFTTARYCARAALRRLGVAPAPILPGERGAPGWPAGIVGSMTHCLGYRAAALARRRDVVTIGIDAEPNEPLPHGVLDAVSIEAERALLARLALDAPRVHWDRLLFSAKESVYKAWYPLTGRWLDFAEADVVIDPAVAGFTARLLVPGPVVAGREHREFVGRYLVRGGLVVTAIAVPV
ncbi:4'-phosphopantetheinyl transferase family protein [Micromonospora sp. CPCC 206061]|uniref:4'-phosphopantetheinyl transferase family protein n=1 Tax=Micromonospora sp. CPCC 206061 TaxID=3122410 RepID=UPI002FF335BA